VNENGDDEYNSVPSKTVSPQIKNNTNTSTEDKFRTNRLGFGLKQELQGGKKEMSVNSSQNTNSKPPISQSQRAEAMARLTQPKKLVQAQLESLKNSVNAGKSNSQLSNYNKSSKGNLGMKNVASNQSLGKRGANVVVLPKQLGSSPNK
jgi:hypothetical protein